MSKAVIINILTRTSNRPNLFKRCAESIREQTYKKIRHYVCVDALGSVDYVKNLGIKDFLFLDKEKIINNDNSTNLNTGPYAPYNLYLNSLLEIVKEGWVLFLDDDDELANPDAIAEIVANIPNEDALIIWQMKMPNGELIPHSGTIKDHPTLGNIGSPCFLVNLKYAKTIQWDAWKCGDFRYFTQLYKIIPEKVYIEKPLVTVNQIGLGEQTELTDSNFRNDLYSPLKQIESQMFWAASPSSFSEEKSIKKNMQIGTDPMIVSFQMPQENEDVNYIRFDLGNTPGLINIHDIKIKTPENNELWAWNQEINKQSNVIFIENDQHWPDKIIQLSTSIDPQFVIQINDKVNVPLRGDVIVEVTLSAIDSKQLDVMYNNITPLSFHTEKNVSELKVFNEKLTRGIVDLNKEQFQFKDVKDENEAYLRSIQKIKEERIELLDDKSILKKELTLKNELIDKLTAEHQETKNELDTIGKEAAVKAALIDQNKIQLWENKNEILKLNHIKDQHEEKLLQFNQLQLQLKQLQDNIENSNKELAKEKLELNDKKQLIAKIENDLQIANSLQQEKNTQLEDSRRVALEYEKVIGSLSNDVSLLHQELSNKEKVIDFLKTQKENVLAGLAKQENLLIEVKTENESYKIKLEEIISGLNQLVRENVEIKAESEKYRSDQELLFSKLLSQNNLLLSEIETANKANTELRLLIEKESEATKETIKEKEKRIAALQNFYEDKNLMQIIYNRISGRKIS